MGTEDLSWKINQIQNRYAHDFSFWLFTFPVLHTFNNILYVKLI